MTQSTDEQRQVAAVTERAMTQLAACVDGLPAEERSVLAGVLQQREVADRRTDDTAGYFYFLQAWLTNYRVSRPVGEELIMAQPGRQKH